MNLTSTASIPETTKEFAPQPIKNPLSGDPFGVTVHRLANGLTVYLSPNPMEPRVYYEIAIRAGSRHDPLEATGMAHYLEHMQFKGTHRLGTLDFKQEKPHLDRIQALYDQLFDTSDAEKRKTIYADIDKESQAAARQAVANETAQLFSLLGFEDVNAHTGQDATVFEGSFPSNRAEAWARIEADRLTSPVYRLFLPELETVYEEYNRYRDNAEAAFLCAALEALFSGHPYGREIIGLGAHLKNPSISRMREFFDFYYRPNNMAIILSGNFERGQMLSLIERSFSALKEAPLPPAPAGKFEKIQGIKRREVLHQAEEKMCIAWPIPGHNHPDEDALILMDMLMDNQWTGLLNLSVNKAQKVKISGSFPLTLNEAGAWFAWASPKEGQSLEEAEQVLLEAVEKLKAGEFKEDDLKAVITDFEVRQKRQLERNQSRVAFIRESFATGTSWEEALARLERLKRVTKADVLRVANRYLGPDRVVVCRRKGNPHIEKVAKPAFTPIDITAARQSRFFEELIELPAKPLTPHFLTRGKDYQTLERPWGRLYHTRSAINNIFHLEFRFDFGARHEKKLKLALKLLDLSGAHDLSVEEFNRALYRLGSTMHVQCDDRECVVWLSGIEENLQETLRLGLARFSEPHVAAGAFEKMISLERIDRESRKISARQVLRALEEFVQRGPESPTLNELSAQELTTLSEWDLKTVLRSLFDHRRSVLYRGNLGADETVKLLSSAENRKKWRETPAPKPIALITPKRPRVIFTHQDHLSQALIGAYAADGSYAAATRLHYNVFNAVMDGMSGAYFQEVREARALAYTAVGGYHPAMRQKDGNMLWSRAETQGDKAVETSLLLQELMRHPPLTPERFASALRQCEESYRAKAYKLEEIPWQMYRWHLLGFNSDPRRESFRKLRALKIGHLKNFAARFAKKPLTFYVLADRSRIDAAGLKKLGSYEERSVNDLFPF